ncbi:MAG: AAA family ATPase [Thiolinea sp.]
MSIFIKKLHIKHFKSCYDLEMKNIGYFSVFAGANGSGKSNFFDALDFVGQFIRSGVEAALNQQGGYQHFRPARYPYPGAAPNFLLKLICDLEGKEYDYTLILSNLDSKAGIEETLLIDGHRSLSRIWGGKPTIDGIEQNLSDTHSALLLYDTLPLRELLSNIRIYRIQPLYAAQANRGGDDSSSLRSDGSNLASVLQRLEKDSDTHDSILSWMRMVVSGLEKFSLGKKNLTNSTGISFKESGTGNLFPANMVSTGTIYLLCLLVAILDAPKEQGLILFEEPELGLHPKALHELINLIRNLATEEHIALWMTTHSEAIVRQLHLNELWLVDKKLGNTRIKHTAMGELTDDDLEPLDLDELWLSNFFDGGVPW